MAGIWTAIPALSAEETWIHYVIMNHPGIVTFFLGDIMVFIVVTTLTTAQASQVIDKKPLHFLTTGIKNH